jgi:hypothetical protein
MIRRDVIAKNGTIAGWVLIQQIDHAQLARQLAQSWQAESFAPLDPRDELLWAIEHHDDGWLAWDARPQVDSHSGVPRQFLEMQAEETREIWGRSIDAAAERGALEGYLVAGHFCRLGRRATAGHEADARIRPLIDLLDHYERQSQDWLERWQRSDPAANTTARVTRALDLLQFFDTFSLWFCCAELDDEREVVETPAGPDLALVPRGATRVSVSPWPWSQPSLELSVAGRFVPRDHYADAEQLASAPSHAVDLRWRVTPV